jgi:hypothetical protein
MGPEHHAVAVPHPDDSRGANEPGGAPAVAPGRKQTGYRNRLGEIALPTLVLCGRFDVQFAPACSEELAAGIPNARMVLFRASNHFPFVEEPEAFWCDVRDFLGAATAGVTGTLPRSELEPSGTRPPGTSGCRSSCTSPEPEPCAYVPCRPSDTAAMSRDTAQLSGGILHFGACAGCRGPRTATRRSPRRPPPGGAAPPRA